MRVVSVLCLFAAAAMMPTRVLAREGPALETLFRAEIELVAHKLRLKPERLDPKLALALAASGATWNPSSGRAALIKTEGKRSVYTGWADRWQGLQAASAAADARTEFAFALSLILDPAPDRTKATHAMQIVSRYGDGLDLALMGIIGAPDNVPLLSRLQYAAADALVWRYDTRHTQFWLALTDSADTYLRSRAVAALGLIAYTEGDRRGSGRGPLQRLLLPVRESPISAAQRLMFSEILLRSAGHKSYRVRAAAAFALGLVGGDKAHSRLIQLAKDRAYVITSAGPGGMRTVAFPVRDAAAAALRRYGVVVRPSGGTFNLRDFRTATRGCWDVTRDTRGMKKDLRGGIPFYDGVW